MKQPLSAQQGWPSLQQRLGKEDSLWVVSAVVLGAVAVVKGCHAPGEWALAQSQLSYRYGFIKRGFLGTIFDLLGLHHRAPLTWVFSLELAALLVVLSWFTYKSGLHRRFSSYAVVALFAGSYIVTFLCSLIGNFDIVLAAATTTLLLVHSPRTRFLLGLIVVPASMLTHEAYLLWFLPSLLLSFVLDAVQADAAPRRILLYLLSLATLALALAGITSLHSSLSGPKVRAMRRDMATRIDFGIPYLPLAVLRLSLRDNMRETAETRKKPVWKQQMVSSVCDLLPVSLLLLHFLRRAVQALLKDSSIASRRWVVLSLAAVLVAPLFIHLVAWDADRFNVLAALALFLALLQVCQRLPGVTLSLSKAEKTAIALVIVFQVAAVYGVIDRSPFVGRVVSHML